MWQTRLCGCTTTRISSGYGVRRRSSTTIEISGPSTAGDEPRGGQFYLRSWYSLAQKISRECQLKAFGGLQAQGANDLCKHLSARLCCHEVPENGSLSRIMANVEPTPIKSETSRSISSPTSLKCWRPLRIKEGQPCTTALVSGAFFFVCGERLGTEMRNNIKQIDIHLMHCSDRLVCSKVSAAQSK